MEQTQRLGCPDRTGPIAAPAFPQQAQVLSDAGPLLEEGRLIGIVACLVASSSTTLGQEERRASAGIAVRKAVSCLASAMRSFGPANPYGQERHGIAPFA
jgi:hypothetical protein